MLQQLIDELRKSLPGYNVAVDFAIMGDASGRIDAWQESGELGASASFGPCASCETPDEALTLLRQRLGLEGEK
jgi:hypothetical protein